MPLSRNLSAGSSADSGVATRQERGMSPSDSVVNDIAARYFLILGAAAADLWSELPQHLQQRLFERAVVLGHQREQDESLREQLAKFLHDHQARTFVK
jgi:glucose-6-phosphate-specific signal transduction histidine kinase